MIRRNPTWSGLRRAVVVCAATATVVGAPTTALAADNPPPLRPLVQDLRTGSQECAAGEARAYVRTRPTLDAVLHDAGESTGQAGPVHGELEVWWTGEDGTEQRHTYLTGSKSSGSHFSWQTPEVPPGTVIAWRVRAADAAGASAWSDAGDGHACEFVYDDKAPDRPVVSSPDYDDVDWHDGVGVYGSFTMESPTDDTVAYVYSFKGGREQTVRPKSPGGPVTVRYLPEKTGLDFLTVVARDRAGNGSAPATYQFRVGSGRAPVAEWKLDDAVGTTSAAAAHGPAARAGAGVSFGGPAPSGTALVATATLDGTADAYLSAGTSVLDPAKTFAVGGWVRPAATDRDMTLASQDGGAARGFSLELRAADSGPQWSFATGGARVSGGSPESGEWAYVLGVRDAETGLARLYVNGREVGTAQRTDAAGPAPGAFQIGRPGTAPASSAGWRGEIGDVRVYDRVVVPAEAAQLATRAAQLKGHWSLESDADGTSPELYGGTPLNLSDGAAILRAGGDDFPLVGDGHLTFDGVTGHAATAGPVLDTADSFSIGVVVRLADDAPDHPMTVLSQGDADGDAFKVRYVPDDYAWQLVMSDGDDAGGRETVVGQISAPDGGMGQGHQLTVIHDAAADQIRLYLDGSTNADATASFHGARHSDGGLQVGRGHVNGAWGEYLHGAVDEVHAFSGVLSQAQIAALGLGYEP
ncbi:LamG-like jellyroll fold domain-containing protein [Streptomyces sp. NPDC049813]|uniref:LamG domain-containing protein n=1 Tax=Streptomyces sp. NPDC049813 TaxID=3365597 RepID=UPI0037B95A7A